MTISFSLAADDFSRFQKVIARRFRRKGVAFSMQFLLRVVVWMCIGFAGAGYARLISENPDIAHSLQIVACFLVVATAAIVALPYVSQALLRKHMLSPSGAFLSPQTIEFTDKALVVTSTIARAEILWSGLHAIDEDDDNYYLFIDAMQAVILPRRAIESLVSELQRHTSHLK